MQWLVAKQRNLACLYIFWIQLLDGENVVQEVEGGKGEAHLNLVYIDGVPALLEGQ